MIRALHLHFVYTKRKLIPGKLDEAKQEAFKAQYPLLKRSKTHKSIRKQCPFFIIFIGKGAPLLVNWKGFVKNYNKIRIQMASIGIKVTSFISFFSTAIFVAGGGRRLWEK